MSDGEFVMSSGTSFVFGLAIGIPIGMLLILSYAYTFWQ